MKIFKLIFAWIIVSSSLLVPVVLVDFVHSLFAVNAATTEISYPLKDVLLGVAGESLRAVLLCYLYVRMKNAGRSYSFSVWFGIVTSALIASMWLIIGYGSFVLKNPEKFVISDGIILALQGVMSGAALQFLFTKKWIKIE